MLLSLETILEIHLPGISAAVHPWALQFMLQSIVSNIVFVIAFTTKCEKGKGKRWEREEEEEGEGRGRRRGGEVKISRKGSCYEHAREGEERGCGGRGCVGRGCGGEGQGGEGVWRGGERVTSELGDKNVRLVESYNLDTSLFRTGLLLIIK